MNVGVCGLHNSVCVCVCSCLCSCVSIFIRTKCLVTDRNVTKSKSICKFNGRIRIKEILNSKWTCWVLHTKMAVKSFYFPHIREAVANGNYSWNPVINSSNLIKNQLLYFFQEKNPKHFQVLVSQMFQIQITVLVIWIFGGVLIGTVAQWLALSPQWVRFPAGSASFCVEFSPCLPGFPPGAPAYYNICLWVVAD